MIVTAGTSRRYALKNIMAPKLPYVVYMITFPNGKIYVGKDIGGEGHSLRYFGSWSNAALLHKSRGGFIL